MLPINAGGVVLIPSWGAKINPTCHVAQPKKKKKMKQNMFLQVDSDGHNRIH